MGWVHESDVRVVFLLVYSLLVYPAVFGVPVVNWSHGAVSLVVVGVGGCLYRG